jgi:hypothetical protein
VKESKLRNVENVYVSDENKAVVPDNMDRRLLELEVGKVFAEIQGRISNIDNWFHYKFLLVGGVMLAFITKFSGVLANPFDPHTPVPLGPIDIKDTVALILASSCVVAFAADIHIRIEMAMTGMLGRWIADFVEPALETGLGLHYWENYLRQDHALHTSWISQFTFAPHLHFLTWPLYMAYVWVFQEITLRGRTANTALVKGTFIIVQTSLFVFVLVSHSTPLAYGLTVHELRPGYTFAAFLLLYFLVVSPAIPYYARLARQ